MCPLSRAPLGPICTKNSHVVITEALANIYAKVDSIPTAEQEKFAHFSLLGVQFLTHHHWLEETIMCMSLFAPGLLLLPSHRYSVPALEPEWTSPAVQEHATFAEAMHNLEHYLEDACGFEKNEKGHAVPAPGKKKAAFDAAKIKYLIEELCGPMFVHVSPHPQVPHPTPILTLTALLS
jgi:hypothetical protein